MDRVTVVLWSVVGGVLAAALILAVLVWVGA